ncbi:MAG TPA: hypothetical protein VMR81_00445 [Patescibacteria group bacterium]|jgi:hypothetical protein|nr:hypothetical protein [Patescibacteria group bacterium]
MMNANPNMDKQASKQSPPDPLAIDVAKVLLYDIMPFSALPVSGAKKHGRYR